MRILTHLEANNEADYETAYHRSIRGRIWETLNDTRFEDRHDEPIPAGYCYSNPFPPSPMEPGDSRTLLISSVDEEMLANIAAGLLETPKLDIKDMAFRVDDITSIETDVGEPGTEGVLHTPTGVCVRIAKSDCEEYGIDSPKGTGKQTYWEPDYGLEPFVDRVEDNLQQKHELYGRDELPGPAETEGRLFDSLELEKTMAMPVRISDSNDGVDITIIASIWTLGYVVRDVAHRHHLNLALDAGIGERNGFGFGFLNLEEKNGEEL